MREPGIYIEAKDLDLLGTVHLYLVYLDATGNEWILRSGPSGSVFSSLMLIEVNTPIDVSPDARGGLSPEDRNSTKLEFDGLSDDEAWAIMVRYSREFQTNAYEYQVFGTNSNSYIGAMIASTGLDPYTNLPVGISSSQAVGIQYYSDMVSDITPPPNGDVLGTDNADILIGIQIDERIYGLESSDELNGGAGDDELYAGAGNDTLTGGAGNDTFILAPGYGANTITDFEIGQDIIRLIDSEFTSAAEALSAISKPQADISRIELSDGSYLDIYHSSQVGTPLTLASFLVIPSTSGNIPPTGDILISGDAVEDSQLFADSSSLDDPNGLGLLSYQWLRDGTVIPGAIDAIYDLTQADVGTQISVFVSYVDGGGTPESLSSGPTEPIKNLNDAPIGDITILGLTRMGELLRVDSSTLEDPDGLGLLSYQWLRSGGIIPNATDATYRLTQADVGAQISVYVRYTDGFETPEELLSAPTEAVAALNHPPTGSVVILGTAQQGQRLWIDSATLEDPDGLGLLSYQWLRDGAVIPGADDDIYDLTQADIGTQISLIVQYTDGLGTLEEVRSNPTEAVAALNHPPTGSVGILGTAQQGQRLLIDSATLEDPDGLGLLSYQWLRDGAVIPGADDDIYDLTQADIGTQISLIVQYTDGLGTLEEVRSNPTPPVTSTGELIIGTPDPDALIGTVGNDTLQGLADDDHLTGAGANDILDGGTGYDTAFYSGAQTSYTLTLSPSEILLTDRRENGNGTDTLINVELLDFEIEAFAFDFDLTKFAGPAGIAADDLSAFIEFYIAYFDRAPDAVGLFFWATAFAEGTTLEEIASLFIDQEETRGTYPSTQASADFATSVYENVLGRIPDQAGFEFWVDLLEGGTVSRDQFILEVLRGAHAEPPIDAPPEFIAQQLADRAYLETKVDIGAYFAVHKGMSNVGTASTVMELFDGSTDSIDTAIAAIELYHTTALDADTGEFLMPLIGVLESPFITET
jgi:Ca2+-binding RTX toxin-like protein